MAADATQRQLVNDAVAQLMASLNAESESSEMSKADDVHHGAQPQVSGVHPEHPNRKNLSNHVKSYEARKFYESRAVLTSQTHKIYESRILVR